MNEFFLEVGDEMAISVFLNQKSQGSIVMKRSDKHMIEVNIYANDEEDTLWINEALTQGIAAIQSNLELLKLKTNIRRRIHEFDDEDREGGDVKAPYPADDDIPF